MTVKFELFVDRTPPHQYLCVQVTEQNLDQVAAMMGRASVVDGAIRWEAIGGWAMGRAWIQTPPGHWICERPDGGWFSRSPEEMQRMFKRADG